MSKPSEVTEQQANYSLDGMESQTQANLGAELLRRADESQAAVEATWNDLMTALGINEKKIEIGIEKLREIIKLESGVLELDNSFTQELINNRENCCQ